MYDGVIMRLVKVLPSDMRDEAYHVAHSLSQHYPTVLSPATDVYRVWVDVRCPDDFNPSMSLLTMPLEDSPLISNRNSNRKNRALALTIEA